MNIVVAASPFLLQLSADVDDVSNVDRLCSASAIFLALYSRSPHERDSVSGQAPGNCRLGELLRHVRVNRARCLFPVLLDIVQSCRDDRRAYALDGLMKQLVGAVGSVV